MSLSMPLAKEGDAKKNQTTPRIKELSLWIE